MEKFGGVIVDAQIDRVNKECLKAEELLRITKELEAYGIEVNTPRGRLSYSDIFEMTEESSELALVSLVAVWSVIIGVLGKGVFPLFFILEISFILGILAASINFGLYKLSKKAKTIHDLRQGPLPELTFEEKVQLYESFADKGVDSIVDNVRGKIEQLALLEDKLGEDISGKKNVLEELVNIDRAELQKHILSELVKRNGLHYGVDSTQAETILEFGEVLNGLGELKDGVALDFEEFEEAKALEDVVK